MPLPLALGALLAACGDATSRPPTPPAGPALAGEPSYAEWDRLLGGYYHREHGMDYGGLKRREAAALAALRGRLARVDVTTLERPQQLAYWINLYNVNVVAIVVEAYPIASIRDLSTDPLRRLNVFSRDSVPFAGGLVSLDAIEHQRLREGFHDPRIHFAINCAAVGCPPLREEAMVGARVEAQLADQSRRFAAGPGVQLVTRGGTTVLRLNKVMEWFRDDFERWGGGLIPFLRRHLPPGQASRLPADPKIELLDYDWSLNDWRR